MQRTLRFAKIIRGFTHYALRTTLFYLIQRKVLHVPFGGFVEALGVHYLGGEGLHFVQASVNIDLGLRVEDQPARVEEAILFVREYHVYVVLAGQLRQQVLT